MAQHWDLTTRSLNQYLQGEKLLDAALATKIGATFDWAPELLLRVQLKNLEDFDQEDYSLKQLIAS